MPIVLMSFIGLFAFFPYAIRSVSTSWEFGVVTLNIPVVNTQKLPAEYQHLEGAELSHVDDLTTLVVLTEKEFYFGAIDDFTAGYHQVRNKFRVPHLNGKPHAGILFDHLHRWFKQKHMTKKSDSTVVILPHPNIPVNLITQMTQYFKNANMYEHVILARNLQ
ncbi:MAG: hypothetical protein AB8C84_06825 [Oligoflexales bacterium]